MLVLVTLAIAAATATPSTEWPVYRHNRTLTSVSPITGNLTQPSILLEHPLGVPAPQFTQMVSHRQPHQADLDGDGNLENVVVTSEGVTVQNAVGRTLWRFTYPSKEGSSLLRLFDTFRGEHSVESFHYFPSNRAYHRFECRSYGSVQP